MLFAFAGNVGSAILFIFSMISCVLLSFYTLGLAAHFYHVVIHDTMAGLDEVRWPDEPAIDRLLSSLPLLWLAALWLAPIEILNRLLAKHWLVGEHALRFLLLGGPVLWLFFPPSLLSTLASSSGWQILNGRVLLGLLRLFPSLLLFYLLTAALLALGLGAAFLCLFSPQSILLPLFALIASIVWLLHARLVGRLGWLLSPRLRSVPTPSPAPRSQPKRNRSSRSRSRSISVNDPWAIPSPPPEEPPSSSAIYPFLEQPSEPPPRPAYLDPEPQPYSLADLPPDQAPTPPPPYVQLNHAQVERETQLRLRKPPNPPPQYPLFSGVFSFPFYSTSVAAWAHLGFAGTAAAALFRAARSFFPF